MWMKQNSNFNNIEIKKRQFGFSQSHRKKNNSKNRLSSFSVVAIVRMKGPKKIFVMVVQAIPKVSNRFIEQSACARLVNFEV